MTKSIQTGTERQIRKAKSGRPKKKENWKAEKLTGRLNKQKTGRPKMTRWPNIEQGKLLPAISKFLL